MALIKTAAGEDVQSSSSFVWPALLYMVITPYGFKCEGYRPATVWSATCVHLFYVSIHLAIFFFLRQDSSQCGKRPATAFLAAAPVQAPAVHPAMHLPDFGLGRLGDPPCFEILSQCLFSSKCEGWLRGKLHAWQPV